MLSANGAFFTAFNQKHYHHWLPVSTTLKEGTKTYLSRYFYCVGYKISTLLFFLGIHNLIDPALKNKTSSLLFCYYAGVLRLAWQMNIQLGEGSFFPTFGIVNAVNPVNGKVKNISSYYCFSWVERLKLLKRNKTPSFSKLHSLKL